MTHTGTIAGKSNEVFIPHLGWLAHAPDEELARSLDEGWFEYREQAFCRLYLHKGAVVIDCGAHIGLFSVLAGRLVGAEGRVIAIEPHPDTSAILEQNLRSHRLASARVVRAAVGNRRGIASLALGPTGRAAYSSLLPIEGAEQRVEVPALTLDELAAADQIREIDLLKLDVEGLEIEALAGARRLLTENRVRVLLIEFTERNLNLGGHSTVDLRDAILGAGYALYRFDDHHLELQPAAVTAPIAYENLFAINGPADAVNDRLRQASAGRRRAAQQIIRRGRACMKLHTSVATIAPLRRQLEAFTAQAEAFAARIEEQDEQMQLLQAQVKRLELEKRDTLQMEDKMRRNYNRIRNSRSWRYTRPLRGLTDLLVSLTELRQY